MGSSGGVVQTSKEDKAIKGIQCELCRINIIRLGGGFGALSKITHLSDGLQTTVRLQLVHSVRLGLAVGATLGDRAFAASAADAHAEDREALLGLVSQAASLVGAGRPRGAVELGHLAVLPDADTQQVAHHIALLLAVELLHVAVGSHLEGSGLRNE